MSNFEYPKDWVADFTGEAGFFYPKGPHGGYWPVGGALYVRVQVVPAPQTGATTEAVHAYLRSKRKGARLTRSAQGWSLVHYTEQREDEDHTAVDYHWLLAAPSPPESIMVAQFPFTGVAELFGDQECQCYEIIEMLDQEVANAKLQGPS